MTQDQHDAIARYPDAFSVYDGDKQAHKVYRKISGVAVAISGSWETRSTAWADAAIAMREKDHPTVPLHEGDDGR